MSSRAPRCQEKDEIQHFRPGGNCGCAKFGGFNSACLKCLNMSPNTVALWGLMGDGCVLQRLQKHQSPTHPNILWGLCGLGVLKHHQDHIAGFKEMLIRRFFSAADGQLEAWPVDEERPLPRALAKDDVRMSGCQWNAGQHWLPPCFFNQKWESLSTKTWLGMIICPTKTRPTSMSYMLFPEAFSQVQPLRLSRVDSNIKSH